jgi:hypothetical protein
MAELQIPASLGVQKLSPLCLNERQHPVFQVQMHVRRRVPLLKIVSWDAMLSKLRVAKPQLIFAHVVHFMAPLAVGRSAANYEWFHHKR